MVGFVTGIVVHAYPVTSKDFVVWNKPLPMPLELLHVDVLGTRLTHPTILPPELKNFGFPEALINMLECGDIALQLCLYVDFYSCSRRQKPKAMVTMI